MSKCAAGRGTSAAYRGSSYAYYSASLAAARQAAMARAAAIARQTRLFRQAATDAARLDAADRAYREGDINVASRMYMSLARAKSPIAAQGKQRLAQLSEDALQKVGKIDATLTEEGNGPSPGELFSPGGPPARWKDLVTTAFQEYDRVAEGYRLFRPARRKITTHVAKQRRRPEIAVVLNEPEAKALWESGQEHEADGHLCCAYWVYERAARLTPAPSARLASDRLAEMKQDPEIVASAAACRELQECHKIYNRAKRVRELRPARARELFAEILQRAPEDSEVYRTARAELQGME